MNVQATAFLVVCWPAIVPVQMRLDYPQIGHLHSVSNLIGPDLVRGCLAPLVSIHSFALIVLRKRGIAVLQINVSHAAHAALNT